MSEKKPFSPESKSSAETLKRSSFERRTGTESAAEKPESEANAERFARKELDDLHEAAEQDRPLELMSDEDSADQKIRITKQDKNRAYAHTMKQVQRKLTKPSRRFSRVIHNPVVERVSEAMEKTVARPSGILGGALFAAAGLAAMSFFARRYGFALSGSELILFVLAGWLAGLVIEFIWRKLT